ncbi:MAG: ATP-binding cassette domain-containing protein [Planctomycetia bacterium]|nr:ATP-binding cassette domain-containing protein [Planctomycetia bacterium]
MDDAVITCPSCQTVNPDGTSKCPRCGSTLAWLRDTGRFADALRNWAKRYPELCWEVIGKNGTSAARLAAPGTSELIADGIRLVVTWNGGLGIELRAPNGRHGWKLPGEKRVDGLVVRASLVATAPHTKAPPVTAAPDNKEVKPYHRTLGKAKGDARHVELNSGEVEDVHAIVVREAGSGHYWLVDNCTAEGCTVGGTFVNRRRIIAHRLSNNDLVQMGPFSWTVRESGRHWLRAEPIDGPPVDFCGVLVKNRLDRLDLSIPAKEFVAIVGPSGAGKSTLVQVLVGVPRVADKGTVHVGGCKLQEDGSLVTAQLECFRQLLGYVSQQEVLHEELTATQAVEFAARLRGHRDPDAGLALRQVDIVDEERPIRDLSGGERKRVRIAAELATNPRLLVLDEPGSGLDRDREAALMHLLRNLSYRGCTVIVVSHNLGSLHECDRVLVLHPGGKLVTDRTPEELRELIPSGELSDFDLSTQYGPVDRPEGGDGCVTRPLGEIDAADGVLVRWAKQGLRQFGTLLKRELYLLTNSLWRRIALPVVVVPTVLAGAIGVTVKVGELPLLGFLAILATTWLGASLGLLAIANERPVYEHERLLFLRIGPYVTAKTAILWTLSSVQTTIFFLLVWTIRRHPEWAGFAPDGDYMLFSPWSSLLYLWLVGLAATGLGLVISASVGGHVLAANSLLPFFMVGQIVFSVHGAGNGDGPLETSYGGFTLHHCAAHPDRRAIQWRRKDSDSEYSWICECEERAGDDCKTQQSGLPSRAAVLSSYFTLSRYADIVLRSFAYGRDAYKAYTWRPSVEDPIEPAHVKNDGYPRWRHEAALTLLSMFVGLPLLTATILHCQARWMKSHV